MKRQQEKGNQIKEVNETDARKEITVRKEFKENKGNFTTFQHRKNTKRLGSIEK